MRIELTLDKRNPLPPGALDAFHQEFSRRIQRRYPDCAVQVRQAGANGLSVLGGIKSDREIVETILQETWESADDWFSPDYPE
ncbi:MULTISPECIES: DNA damage-inducible protein I [Edwardsiella]|uniref:DNA damage-inducible protein I n=2 Tax=Edwardsiella anguillarum TaxID=1821960 RepID=A0A076LI06_9GAMM|nr:MULTISPECIES: DNA damage-inducible protein I [Edwardsiella]AKM47607.1 XRE family transcriptional regulator [Edwardsiella sp. EA181011]GAJ69113.1 DinI-like family protein [Edwardsiella piscicida]AIJ06547.1 DNA damage-inducible protein I [Edwardsiella anguillarum ET080813]AKR78093.1 DNA damage-inducible protein I [Edwardsiella sp. LADL05-105]KAB0593197.1 DNA damage-inducible protein I [Edwardsiella anguillarum]